MGLDEFRMLRKFSMLFMHSLMRADCNANRWEMARGRFFYAGFGRFEALMDGVGRIKRCAYIRLFETSCCSFMLISIIDEVSDNIT